ncbi:hypothetical protein Tco_1165309 [Tanacetum coccineum]
MSLPVRLYRITLGALITFPFLLTMLPTEMLLNAGQIAKSPSGFMVHAVRLRTDIYSFLDLNVGWPLLLLPWQVVASPVELKYISVSLRNIDPTENLAVDHLFRLENPHQSELEKKEITETFPLETLGMVTFRDDDNAPWFANFANYHAGNFVIKGMSS